DGPGSLREAGLYIFDRVLGILLVFDRQAVVVLGLEQSLEEFDCAQVSASENREVLGSLDVLQVDAIDAIAECLDGGDGILPRTEEVARVDTAADLVVVVLDRISDRIDLCIAMARAMVVDADRDTIGLDELVEIVERGGIGIGGKIADPHRFREFEYAAI